MAKNIPKIGTSKRPGVGNDIPGVGSYDIGTNFFVKNRYNKNY